MAQPRPRAAPAAAIALLAAIALSAAISADAQAFPFTYSLTEAPAVLTYANSTATFGSTTCYVRYTMKGGSGQCAGLGDGQTPCDAPDAQPANDCATSAAGGASVETSLVSAGVAPRRGIADAYCECAGPGTAAPVRAFQPAYAPNGTCAPSCLEVATARPYAAAPGYYDPTREPQPTALPTPTPLPACPLAAALGVCAPFRTDSISAGDPDRIQSPGYGPERWYTFSVPSAGSYRISTCDGPGSSQTALHLFDTPCPLSPADIVPALKIAVAWGGCSAAGTTGRAVIVTQLRAGAVYSVAVEVAATSPWAPPPQVSIAVQAVQSGPYPGSCPSVPPVPSLPAIAGGWPWPSPLRRISWLPTAQSCAARCGREPSCKAFRYTPKTNAESSSCELLVADALVLWAGGSPNGRPANEMSVLVDRAGTYACVETAEGGVTPSVAWASSLRSLDCAAARAAAGAQRIQFARSPNAGVESAAAAKYYAPANGDYAAKDFTETGAPISGAVAVDVGLAYRTFPYALALESRARRCAVLCASSPTCFVWTIVAGGGCRHGVGCRTYPAGSSAGGGGRWYRKELPAAGCGAGQDEAPAAPGWIAVPAPGGLAPATSVDGTRAYVVAGGSIRAATSKDCPAAALFVNASGLQPAMDATGDFAAWPSKCAGPNRGLSAATGVLFLPSSDAANPYVRYRYPSLAAAENTQVAPVTSSAYGPTACALACAEAPSGSCRGFVIYAGTTTLCRLVIKCETAPTMPAGAVEVFWRVAESSSSTSYTSASSYSFSAYPSAYAGASTSTSPPVLSDGTGCGFGTSVSGPFCNVRTRADDFAPTPAPSGASLEACASACLADARASGYYLDGSLSGAVTPTCRCRLARPIASAPASSVHGYADGADLSTAPVAGGVCLYVRGVDAYDAAFAAGSATVSAPWGTYAVACAPSTACSYTPGPAGALGRCNASLPSLRCSMRSVSCPPGRSPDARPGAPSACVAFDAGPSALGPVAVAAVQGPAACGGACASDPACHGYRFSASDGACAHARAGAHGNPGAPAPFLWRAGARRPCTLVQPSGAVGIRWFDRGNATCGAPRGAAGCADLSDKTPHGHALRGGLCRPFIAVPGLVPAASFSSAGAVTREACRARCEAIDACAAYRFDEGPAGVSCRLALSDAAVPASASAEAPYAWKEPPAAGAARPSRCRSGTASWTCAAASCGERPGYCPGSAGRSPNATCDSGDPAFLLAYEGCFRAEIGTARRPLDVAPRAVAAGNVTDCLLLCAQTPLCRAAVFSPATNACSLPDPSRQEPLRWAPEPSLPGTRIGIWIEDPLLPRQEWRECRARLGGWYCPGGACNQTGGDLGPFGCGPSAAAAAPGLRPDPVACNGTAVRAVGPGGDTCVALSRDDARSPESWSEPLPGKSAERSCLEDPRCIGFSEARVATAGVQLRARRSGDPAGPWRWRSDAALRTVAYTADYDTASPRRAFFDVSPSIVATVQACADACSADALCDGFRTEAADAGGRLLCYAVLRGTGGTTALSYGRVYLKKVARDRANSSLEYPAAPSEPEQLTVAAGTPTFECGPPGNRWRCPRTADTGSSTAYFSCGQRRASTCVSSRVAYQVAPDPEGRLRRLCRDRSAVGRRLHDGITPDVACLAPGERYWDGTATPAAPALPPLLPRLADPFYYGEETRPCPSTSARRRWHCISEDECGAAEGTCVGPGGTALSPAYRHDGPAPASARLAPVALVAPPAAPVAGARRIGLYSGDPVYAAPLTDAQCVDRAIAEGYPYLLLGGSGWCDLLRGPPEAADYGGAPLVAGPRYDAAPLWNDALCTRTHVGDLPAAASANATSNASAISSASASSNASANATAPGAPAARWEARCGTQDGLRLVGKVCGAGARPCDGGCVDDGTPCCDASKGGPKRYRNACVWRCPADSVDLRLANGTMLCDTATCGPGRESCSLECRPAGARPCCDLDGGCEERPGVCRPASDPPPFLSRPAPAECPRTALVGYDPDPRRWPHESLPGVASERECAAAVLERGSPRFAYHGPSWGCIRLRVVNDSALYWPPEREIANARPDPNVTNRAYPIGARSVVQWPAAVRSAGLSSTTLYAVGSTCPAGRRACGPGACLPVNASRPCCPDEWSHRGACVPECPAGTAGDPELRACLGPEERACLPAAYNWARGCCPNRYRCCPETDVFDPLGLTGATAGSSPPGCVAAGFATNAGLPVVDGRVVSREERRCVSELGGAWSDLERACRTPPSEGSCLLPDQRWFPAAGACLPAAGCSAPYADNGTTCDAPGARAACSASGDAWSHARRCCVSAADGCCASEAPFRGACVASCPAPLVLRGRRCLPAEAALCPEGSWDDARACCRNAYGACASDACPAGSARAADPWADEGYACVPAWSCALADPRAAYDPAAEACRLPGGGILHEDGGDAPPADEAAEAAVAAPAQPLVAVAPASSPPRLPPHDATSPSTGAPARLARACRDPAGLVPEWRCPASMACGTRAARTCELGGSIWSAEQAEDGSFAFGVPYGPALCPAPYLGRPGAGACSRACPAGSIPARGSGRRLYCASRWRVSGVAPAPSALGASGAIPVAAAPAGTAAGCFLAARAAGHQGALYAPPHGGCFATNETGLPAPASGAAGAPLRPGCEPGAVPAWAGAGAGGGAVAGAPCDAMGLYAVVRFCPAGRRSCGAAGGCVEAPCCPGEVARPDGTCARDCAGAAGAGGGNLALVAGRCVGPEELACLSAGRRWERGGCLVNATGCLPAEVRYAGACRARCPPETHVARDGFCVPRARVECDLRNGTYETLPGGADCCRGGPGARPCCLGEALLDGRCLADCPGPMFARAQYEEHRGWAVCDYADRIACLSGPSNRTWIGPAGWEGRPRPARNFGCTKVRGGRCASGWVLSPASSSECISEDECRRSGMDVLRVEESPWVGADDLCQPASVANCTRTGGIYNATRRCCVDARTGCCRGWTLCNGTCVSGCCPGRRPCVAADGTRTCIGADACCPAAGERAVPCAANGLCVGRAEPCPGERACPGVSFVPAGACCLDAGERPCRANSTARCYTEPGGCRCSGMRACANGTCVYEDQYCAEDILCPGVGRIPRALAATCPTLRLCPGGSYVDLSAGRCCPGEVRCGSACRAGPCCPGTVPCSVTYLGSASCAPRTDACGVCNGDNSTCPAGCDGKPGGPQLDENGDCWVGGKRVNVLERALGAGGLKISVGGSSSRPSSASPSSSHPRRAPLQGRGPVADVEALLARIALAAGVAPSAVTVERIAADGAAIVAIARPYAGAPPAERLAASGLGYSVLLEAPDPVRYQPLPVLPEVRSPLWSVVGGWAIGAAAAGVVVLAAWLLGVALANPAAAASAGVPSASPARRRRR